MARIKLPEIKPGDPLSSEQYNDILESLEDFDIDGSNIAEEGINFSQKKVGYPFHQQDDVKNSSSKTVTSEAATNTVLYMGSGVAPDAAGGTKKASDYVYKTANFQPGDYAFCRASCRIKMSDFGSRTFFAGIPPTVSLELRYITFDDPDDEFIDPTALVSGSDYSLWKSCVGTKQLFSCAFSSKIPSDSGGDLMVQKVAIEAGVTDHTTRKHKYRPDLITYTKSDTEYPESRDQYDLSSNTNMFFHYNFSYTTAFPLQILSGHGNVRKVGFALFGHAYNPGGKQGQDGTGIYGSTPEKGCGTVQYAGFQVFSSTISISRIKK